MIVVSLAHNPPIANMRRLMTDLFSPDELNEYYQSFERRRIAQGLADLLAPDALALGRHREAQGLDVESEMDNGHPPYACTATDCRESRCVAQRSNARSRGCMICGLTLSHAARLACATCAN